ncbi:MAG: hypothetical protein V1922_05195 [bacterium]
MRQYIVGFLTALVIVGVVAGAYMLGTRQSASQPVPSPTPQAKIVVSPTQSIAGNDADKHGCIGSAGYSWCEAKQKCLRSWEETCEKTSENDTELIKQALIKKNQWTDGDAIVVTISKNDGTYAKGGVTEKNAQAGGGYFFAVKDKGTWIIVADGNGTISCASLAPYPSYPTTLIPECWDEATGKLVQR